MATRKVSSFAENEATNHNSDVLLQELMRMQPENLRGTQFPWKLHELLTQVDKIGKSDVISWLPGGKSFKVYKKDEFCSGIMPAFFNSSKYKTWQRSLNLWGFESVVRGPDKGACYHSAFVRGQPDLCNHMKRVKIKWPTPATPASGEQRRSDIASMPNRLKTPTATRHESQGFGGVLEVDKPSISDFLRSKANKRSAIQASLFHATLEQRHTAPSMSFLALNGLPSGSLLGFAFPTTGEIGNLSVQRLAGVGSITGGTYLPAIDSSSNRRVAAINIAAAALDIAHQEEEIELLRRART